jgi:GMP synthase PP-ATPase subunit
VVAIVIEDLRAHIDPATGPHLEDGIEPHMNEVRGINREAHHVSSKSPATIEWA